MSLRPDLVQHYFNVYIPNLKLKTLVSEVKLHLSTAKFVANVYRTPTLELEALLQKTDAEWKQVSFLDKLVVKTFGSNHNWLKKVKQEIDFRKENTRYAQDWKLPFIDVANRYPGEEFKEVREYILEDAMLKYQQVNIH